MLERDFWSKKFGKNAAILERTRATEGDDPRDGAKPSAIEQNGARRAKP